MRKWSLTRMSRAALPEVTLYMSRDRGFIFCTNLFLDEILFPCEAVRDKLWCGKIMLWTKTLTKPFHSKNRGKSTFIIHLFLYIINIFSINFREAVPGFATIFNIFNVSRVAYSLAIFSNFVNSFWWNSRMIQSWSRVLTCDKAA